MERMKAWYVHIVCTVVCITRWDTCVHVNWRSWTLWVPVPTAQVCGMDWDGLGPDMGELWPGQAKTVWTALELCTSMMKLNGMVAMMMMIDILAGRLLAPSTPFWCLRSMLMRATYNSFSRCGFCAPVLSIFASLPN